MRQGGMYLAYFERSGRVPARGFLDALLGKEARTVDVKLALLEREGENILWVQGLPNWLRRITGTQHEVFEVRPGQIRIIVYVDRQKHCFVLLHAFRKQKNVQPRDIETGLSYLEEYLAKEGRR